MDGQTFKITICLTGFKSLRNCVSCSFILIELVLVKRESSIYLLVKNIESVLLEILDTKSIFLGCTI